MAGAVINGGSRPDLCPRVEPAALPRCPAFFVKIPMTVNQDAKSDQAGGRDHGKAAWRVEIERLVESVLGSLARIDPCEEAKQVLKMDTSRTKVVIVGGGTGLSTVVGGNSQLQSWPDEPFVGMKQEFPELTVVVCSTDDGGSTGKILQQLPLIGIGDLRKSFVSMIRMTDLVRTYRFSEREARIFAETIRQIFQYRFPQIGADQDILANPVLAADPEFRSGVPRPLARELRANGQFLTPARSRSGISPSGQCLGNLILTAAVFRESGGRTDKPPSLAAIRRGLDRLCRLCGVAPGHLHPATSIPGQLKFRYANGVEVLGQSKSARSRRGFPVERVSAEYTNQPVTGKTVLRAIREADLIVYAPGSLYTSIIPILQLNPIAEAIRTNRKALKILGANFWIQEGETDISLRHSGRGFLVSDLVEAYERNVPGGSKGLFQVVLSANLEHVPGNILRSYELEGKSPIHLDRARVEAMGFLPIEATLFMPGFQKPATVIHHDPKRFSLAIRSVLYAWKNLAGAKENIRRCGRKDAESKRPIRSKDAHRRQGFGKPAPAITLCRYRASIAEALSDKTCDPDLLREILLDLAWQNRDIQPRHLGFFRGARVVPDSEWNRSTLWDNVLGYYDPEERLLKVHEQVFDKSSRIREELLIALGESLLGRYIASRAWREPPAEGSCGARCFEIRLRPEKDRECFLSPTQLGAYLKLARMTPDPRDPNIYRIMVNRGEGFLPPGLLFGLVFAWYLDNSYASTMEYEMSLLRWPPRLLVPHQAKERIRKQALVAFFRTEIFGHREG
jgi:uncharacterized cofD-like protein